MAEIDENEVELEKMPDRDKTEGNAGPNIQQATGPAGWHPEKELMNWHPDQEIKKRCW